MLSGIDHVQLAAPAGCEEDARAFFAGLLGLDELEKPELLQPRGGVWFRVGTQQLHVGVEPDFVAARKAHPAFTVARYDELLHRLRGAGLEISDDDSIAGVRRCYLVDPWGNRLELLAG
jgi:catechol 2,3-dioxygenase-like lactoylglutathione lyase family enzyme